MTRILYIEDDSIDQILMKRAVKNLNIDLTIVSCFTEAEKVLNQYKYNIILTDNFTTDGQILNWINLFKNYPVHVVTGDKAFFSELKKVQFSSIIEKPISTDKIEEILEQRSLLYNLPYFKDAELEQDEISNIVSILLKDFMAFEAFLSTFNQKTDLEMLGRKLHDIIPKFKILNFDASAEFCLSLMENLKSEEKEKIIELESLKIEVNKALSLLKK